MITKRAKRSFISSLSHLTFVLAATALVCGFISCSGVEDAVTGPKPDSSTQEETKRDSSYSQELRLYILENDTVAYSQMDFNAKLTDAECNIGKKLSEYAVKMLVDYEQADEENTVLSPLSATTLYSMMANFTEDNVGNSENCYKEEMGVANVSTDQLNSYSRKIASMQKQSNSGSEEGSNFSMENKLWMKQGKTVYKSFVSTTRAYGTDVRGVDFTKSSGVSAINQAIKESVWGDGVGISASTLTGIESMVTSSLSFEQDWENAFSESRISDYKFKPTYSDSVPCKMLLACRFERHAHYRLFDMLEIPYKNPDFSMFAMLPNENTTLGLALKDLYSLGLGSVLAYTSDATRSYQDITLVEREEEYKGEIYVVYDTIVTDTIVNIRLPHVKYNSTTQLYSAAKSRLYDSDISQVSTTGFRLNNIYQSCYLEINKKGTIAKVSTEVLPDVNTGSGGDDPILPPFGDQPPVGKRIEQEEKCPFYFNRPFALFIRDNSTGTILFSACIREVSN